MGQYSISDNNLRYARGFQSARIRKEYRRIAAEKKRLQAEGVDSEMLRLLCRHMVNLDNKNAERRWWDFYLRSLQKELEFSA
jgi:hypothetical protein